MGLLFSYGFGSAAAYVLARTIADSAFLSHIGTAHLPALYMLSAGIVALFSMAYGEFVRHSRLKTLVLLTLFVLAATSAAMPIVMRRFADSLTVFAVVYLIAQVRGSLGTIQYATLLNEQFAHRSPERVVGLIGAGATLAGITMGLAIGLVADHVDVEALMYLTAGIDLLTMIPVLWLGRPGDASEPEVRPSDNLSTETPSTTNHFRLRNALRSPYIMSIACVVAVSVLVATLVEYQWKVTAASELQRDEEDLAQYFGYFYGTVYLLTGLLQLFVTGRVLQRRGVLAGLMAFPMALLAATCAAWLVSSQRLLLWPVTLSKGCDTLKRSMTDPSVQVIYGPLPHGLRRQAITFVAGIAKPFAEALAAVTLLATAPWMTPRQFSAVIIVLILVWLALNYGVWWRFAVLKKRPDSRS